MQLEIAPVDMVCRVCSTITPVHHGVARSDDGVAEVRVERVEMNWCGECGQERPMTPGFTLSGWPEAYTDGE